MAGIRVFATGGVHRGAQQSFDVSADLEELARVGEQTGGDSLASNIQLVLNNARLAAAIAREYLVLGE